MRESCRPQDLADDQHNCQLTVLAHSMGQMAALSLSRARYDIWAVENFFCYVPNLNVLHGNIGMYLILTPATGSLGAILRRQNPGIPNLSAVAGGGGLSDLFVTPDRFGLAPEASGHPGAGRNDASHGALRAWSLE